MGGLAVVEKITDKTSFAELMMIRAKLGIEWISLDFDPRRLHRCIATVYTNELRVRGTGETEAIALDDAICRLRHRIGTQLSNEQKG